MTTETLSRLPVWLKRPLVASPVIRETEAALAWRGNVLGDLCTRGCRFCNGKRLPASGAGLFAEALGYGG